LDAVETGAGFILDKAGSIEYRIRNSKVLIVGETGPTIPGVSNRFSGQPW
jgi:hypothetical protein